MPADLALYRCQQWLHRLQVEHANEIKADSSLCLAPIVFHRNERILRTLLINGRAWLCAQDLGRLMGIGLFEQGLAKLDADQQCPLNLMTGGHEREWVMVSDCGAFALLVYHLIPENRALRR